MIKILILEEMYIIENNSLSTVIYVILSALATLGSPFEIYI